jgi:UDP-glucose 4-epimerase
MEFKKVIITGGAGFIGSNLANKLAENGVEVHVFDDLSSGKKENLHRKVIFHKIDITEFDRVSHQWVSTIDKIKGTDIIFHCAAKARVQPSIEDPVEFDKQNVKGTLQMLMLAKYLNVKRFVYSASSSCYGNTTNFPTSENEAKSPLSPYGLQKYIGEQYCELFSKLYGVDTVSLRYFNVYGENMNLEGAYKLVIAIFEEQFRNKQPFTINNDGEQRRDFTYVGDVVDANILAAEYPGLLKGDAFNIGNGKNYSVNELANMFGGVAYPKEYGNKVIEPYQTLANNSKAKTLLRWEPKGDLEKWLKGYVNKIS